MRELTAEDFWEKVDTNGPTVRPDLGPCWIWTGKTDKNGYGVTRFEKRTQKAHRVAFKTRVGPLEDDELACHRCDNEPCCRPDHLFKGTHADNSDDKCAKGRQACGETHPALRDPSRRRSGDRHPRRVSPERWANSGNFDPKPGSMNPRAKLTEPDVIRLRAEFAAGRSGYSIAKEVGMGTTTIHEMLTGRTWQHVDGATIRPRWPR